MITLRANSKGFNLTMATNDHTKTTGGQQQDAMGDWKS